ncbi:siderophore synthetase component [Prauserella shujinwangii]|uniref:Siderophore synthetase component n=1 Tax=Prauserella shujinwangii TaxID=1453103 RepID=A0A2T0M177_9PSEU|nr:IucA/IucC family protein [Prauserella shujinwangii]PRX50354.1 siderophore synthetase component [Prauserella shujinwangii]
MTGALRTARRAARQRLLNAYLRETGVHDVPEGRWRLTLPCTGRALTVEVRHRCAFGHHEYAEDTEPGHTGFVTALLAEVEALTGFPGAQRLAGAVASSIAHTARYLACRPARAPADPHARTRHAEQSVLFGHPFHPTPKSSEGFTPDDLARYAPELGAEFVLHYFAVAPELLLDVRVAPGPWVPDDVAARVPPGFLPLPAHPWQARHLLARPGVADLVRSGTLRPLGPLGGPVHPTSSVRTVCDPAFPTCWKLPLGVRITNFVRNNPVEQVRRATDAARLAELLPRHPGFGVLRETGFRTLDPDRVGAGLAADFAVLYRENPFAHNGQAPEVLASLLEHPDRLGRLVRRAGDVAEWLRRYLRISLVPLLSVFATDGFAFEAHVQNSLLCTEDGWPVRFWVRDLEGAAVSRKRLRHHVVPPDSPALYEEAEAWQRLRYHAVTNHLGHLVHVLGDHTGAGERRLWAVARDTLADCPAAAGLLAYSVLPAKANLVSRFTERGETPCYVDVPNPLRERP